MIPPFDPIPFSTNDPEIGPVAEAHSETASADDRELCFYPREATQFSDWERLTLSQNGDLEKALRRLERRFANLSLSLTDFDGEPAGQNGEFKPALEFYHSLNDSKSFYRSPTTFPKVCLSEPQQLSAGEVLDLRFRSHFEPAYKPFLPEYLSYAENQHAFARYWRHPEGKNLGTVIAIHGWFMGDQRVNALALVPGFFFRMGLNVILYELPYHGRRTPAANTAKDGGAGKGSLFPSAHLARTNEAMAQAIFELRCINNWIKQEEGRPVGVVGVSLGGYVAALWAALDPLAFVVPMVPMVSMADLAWQVLSEAKEKLAEDSMFRQLTLESLREAYAIHSPLSYGVQTEKHRRMIIAGVGDAVIPAEQPEALWKHWDCPEIYWFSGGHIGQISQAEAFSRMHRFFLSLKLAHPELLKISV